MPKKKKHLEQSLQLTVSHVFILKCHVFFGRVNYVDIKRSNPFKLGISYRSVHFSRKPLKTSVYTEVIEIKTQIDNFISSIGSCNYLGVFHDSHILLFEIDKCKNGQAGADPEFSVEGGINT